MCRCYSSNRRPAIWLSMSRLGRFGVVLSGVGNLIRDFEFRANLISWPIWIRILGRDEMITRIEPLMPLSFEVGTMPSTPRSISDSCLKHLMLMWMLIHAYADAYSCFCECLFECLIKCLCKLIPLLFPDSVSKLFNCRHPQWFWGGGIEHITETELRLSFLPVSR